MTTSHANSLLLAGCAFLILLTVGSPAVAEDAPPTPLIFDTDIGNDVDDVLALGMIHALQSRGECRLIAVTITKDHALAAPLVDAINTFYGRGGIPIGVCESGVTVAQGRFLGMASRLDAGEPRYPHDLTRGAETPQAVAVLRAALAAEEDGTVVIVQVGFSTNLAQLLRSGPDDASEWTGMELVERKVRLLSIMAGAFTRQADGGGAPNNHREYNVIMDIPSAQALSEDWPTPVVWSGFEAGLALGYPHTSIERDFRYAQHHPLPEAYILYQPPPHDRPTWDLTSVLHAVRPDDGYFGLSETGQVSIDDEGQTTFAAAPNGRDRLLRVADSDRPRVLEAMRLLASQPPDGVAPVP